MISLKFLNPLNEGIFDVQYKHENFTIERMDGKSGGGIKTLFGK